MNKQQQQNASRISCEIRRDIAKLIASTTKTPIVGASPGMREILSALNVPKHIISSANKLYGQHMEPSLDYYPVSQVFRSLNRKIAFWYGARLRP
jgi:hypothetical protein